MSFNIFPFEPFGNNGPIVRVGSMSPTDSDAETIRRQALFLWLTDAGILWLRGEPFRESLAIRTPSPGSDRMTFGTTVGKR